MKNAFSQAFSEGFDRVIVVGSDSPDLPEEYLGLAFFGLGANDVVIGPSSDGGYYLIGFRRDAFIPDAFDQITWSSNKVFYARFEAEYSSLFSRLCDPSSWISNMVPICIDMHPPIDMIVL